MQISSLLQIGRGVTALIGGGGKTTLMYTLAEELKGRGKVIICTSTKIRQPEQYLTLFDATAEEIAAALGERDVLCAAGRADGDKLCAPQLSFEELARLADFVIVEADGAKRLPLKAHAPHEPVIPKSAQRTVLVVGIDGIGKTIAETCHRPALYAGLAGAEENTVVTPEIAAGVILAEGYGDRIYINKVEDAASYEAAQRLGELFACPVVAGSLHMGVYTCLH